LVPITLTLLGCHLVLAHNVGLRRWKHVHWSYADALPSSFDLGRWSAIRGFSHEPTHHHRTDHSWQLRTSLRTRI